MQNLITAFLLPIVLVLGNPLGSVDKWSNEQESFTLAPEAKTLFPNKIGIVMMPNASTSTAEDVVNNTTTPPNKEPSLSEIMEIIENTMNEIETSENKKHYQKTSQNNDNNTGINFEPTTTESDSIESSEDSTESSTAQSSSEQIKFDSAEEKGNPKPEQKIIINEEKNKPIKNYAEKFHNYKPMMTLTTDYPNDPTSSESTTTDNNGFESTTEKGDSKSQEPSIMNDDQTQTQSSEGTGQPPKLHHILLTKNNDLMDKIFLDNPEETNDNLRQEYPFLINNGNTQTHIFFKRPTIKSQSDSLKYYVEPTEPTLRLTTRLLPPKPYSSRTNDWNMYPEIPERQTYSESMGTPIDNDNMMTPQIMTSDPSSDFYQYQPPTRTMQMQQMPYMLQFQPPQPYFNHFNNYNNYQRTSQMFPRQYQQQMYQGNRGLGFYGDYYRSPYWTRPSPIYNNKPSYSYDSYDGYNQNVPSMYYNDNANSNAMSMSGSQYYY